MGSRARGAFDLLPVEQTSMEGWLQHTPRHSAHTLPALAIPPGSPCTAQSSVWSVLLLPAPFHQGPQRTSILPQCRNPTSAAHLGKETSPAQHRLGWKNQALGVPPQGLSSSGTDPGTGLGIAAEHWWDRAACEMPLVFKPSTDCTPCLVLNLPSLASIPAWAPSKTWETTSVPLPTTAQEGDGKRQRGRAGRVCGDR